MSRAPGSANDFVRGKAGNVPFAFGGVSYPASKPQQSMGMTGDEALAWLDSGVSLLMQPPGLSG